MKVVAEWGQSNRGSPEMACRQAHVAAAAGCWASKYQFLTPSWLAAEDAPAYWAHARPGQQQRATFAENRTIAYEAWGEVIDCCRGQGIVFLASAFDLRAVDAMVDLGVPAVKIASGDITYRDLLRHVGQTDLSVILSTGAATEAEIDQALDWLGDSTSVTLLACDLVYPCPPERANLARVSWLHDHFADYDVGYSDHTPGVGAALAAGALGATMLEKHVTLNPLGGTPDDEMGLPWEELSAYVAQGLNGAALRGAYGPGPSLWEAPALVGARRSWHAVRDLPAGHTLEAADVRALRPCRPFDLSASASPVGLILEAAVAEGKPVPAAGRRRRPGKRGE